MGEAPSYSCVGRVNGNKYDGDPHGATATLGCEQAWEVHHCQKSAQALTVGEGHLTGVMPHARGTGALLPHISCRASYGHTQLEVRGQGLVESNP